MSSYLRDLGEALQNPDDWDYAGGAAQGIETLLGDLGRVIGDVKANQPVTVVRLQEIRVVLEAFVEYVEVSASKASALAPSLADDVKVFQAVQRVSVEQRALLVQFSEEVQAAQSSGMSPERWQSLMGKMEGALKGLGVVLAISQIVEASWNQGTQEGLIKTAGAVSGLAAGALGAQLGTGALAVAAAAGAAVTAPVWIGVGIVLGITGAVLVGYGGAKIGEATARFAFQEMVPATLDAVKSILGASSALYVQIAQQVEQQYNEVAGSFDGTWLENLDATDEQKAALTTLLAGVSQLPVSQQFNTDIQRLLEAPFTPAALATRDVLLTAVMRIAQELTSYPTERVTVQPGSLALRMLPNDYASTVALRTQLALLVDPADRAGFALTGADRVVISPTGGTLAGEVGRDLLIGSDTVDGLIGGAGDDELVAGAGDDILLGQEGADVLFGGIGNDVLDGGASSDYLYGGAGNDEYRFSGNFGLGEWVTDSDGQGQLMVDGYGQITSNGAIRTGEHTWHSADDKVYFTRAGTELVIRVNTGAGGTSGAQGVINVRNWQTGHLGLNLGGEVQLSNEHVLGGGNDWGFGEDTPPANTTVVRTGAGHDMVTFSSRDTTRTSFLFGEGGNDLLYGGAAADVIDGGQGNDLITGEYGADVIMGGAGNDLLAANRVGLDLNVQSGWEDKAATWGWRMVGLNPPGSAAQRYLGFLENTDRMIVHLNLSVDGRETQSRRDARYRFLDGDTMFGGTGNDLLWGDDGGDLLSGDEGNDVLLGEAGADTLFGGHGADELDGGDDGDRLYGGEHNDTISGGYGADTVEGNEGNDLISGDLATQASNGQYPAQTRFELMGDDYIDAGQGADTVIGGGGDDTLYGGADNDKLYGDLGSDVERPTTHDGADYLAGQAGNDELAGGGGADTLLGGADNDLLTGDLRDAHLNGAAPGADYLDGGAGVDTLSGDGGADTLYGGTEADLLLGDNATEMVAGANHGADYLDGEDGDDTLVGNGGNDTLWGGQGNDSLEGDATTSDLTEEFHGNDMLDGGAGNDTLFGGAYGRDVIMAGAGNDFVSPDLNNVRIRELYNGNQIVPEPNRPSDEAIWAQEGAGWSWRHTASALGDRVQYIEGTDVLTSFVNLTDGGHRLECDLIGDGGSLVMCRDYLTMPGKRTISGVTV